MSDCYQLQYDVGSWDGQIYDDDFPKELDLDGDDILYCIKEEGEPAESVQRGFFDREEYEKWVTETMPEWERIDVAYQDEEGVLYYEGNDFERDGMYGGYDETGFYYLKEGTVYQDSIRTCSRFTDETREKEDNHYYNIKDLENEITEGEYEAIRSRYIEDMEEYRIHQEWVEFTDVELMGGEIPVEQISCGLLTSYLGSR